MNTSPLHRRHRMPFGAESLQNGRTRFRLWAPAAKSVELCLTDDDRELSFAMEAQSDGWFELITAIAGTGSQYRYRIDGGICVPDPASRYQTEDVHGCSLVVDAESWTWTDAGWQGRPWEEAVVYELHIGSFTQEGSYRAVAEKLDYLAELGITAIQLMPVAEFAGTRGWGYDGVLMFAPTNNYGSPDDLKYLIQTAHGKGIMVFLDVVYNHFGPEGNYLHHYAPAFFNSAYFTPWGAAINFDGEQSYWVRQFFIHNALYWLEEFHFDGLRLDAVHAIFDNARPDILDELAETLRRDLGNQRHIHLILENDANRARYLERNRDGRPVHYSAQWNDDMHHALHALLTGETQGYYIDYADSPLSHLGRCLSEGFAYQGESSPYRNGEPRGEPSAALPPLAFVNFLQNHDQIGNRIFGERLSDLTPQAAVRAATALLLLAPFPPLLFMGQEWGSRRPFLYFCDFAPDLCQSVAEARKREFARYLGFSDPDVQGQLPNPCAEATFKAVMLDWENLASATGRQSLDFHKALLAIRRHEIQPRLQTMGGHSGAFRTLSQRAFIVRWKLGDASYLNLLANLGPETLANPENPRGRIVFALPGTLNQDCASLPPWSVIWTLESAICDSYGRP